MKGFQSVSMRSTKNFGRISFRFGRLSVAFVADLKEFDRAGKRNVNEKHQVELSY